MTNAPPSRNWCRAVTTAAGLAVIFAAAGAAAGPGTTSDGREIEVDTYDHQGNGEGPVEYYDVESGECRTGHLDMHPGGTGTLTDDEAGETNEVAMQ
jgi:hypothetical protein